MVDEQSEDPFGVQLSWPAEQERELIASSPSAAQALVEAGPEGDEAAEAAVAFSAAAGPAATEFPVLPLVIADGDGVATPEGMRALAQVVARIDALAAATTTFRNLISDRVSEYTERVVQVASASAADLEEQRRVWDREIAGLRGGLARTNADIDRLVSAVEALAAEVSRVGTTLGDQLDRVADEVQTLRKRTAVRPRTSSAGRDRDETPPAPRRPVRRRAD